MPNGSPELVCNVILPPDWFESGASTVWAGAEGDQRQFLRKAMQPIAAMQHVVAFPGRPRSQHWHRVFIKDVSRGGIGFLHSEQLFPGEQVRLFLPDEAAARLLRSRGPFLAEIIRCRRLQAQCYLIGGSFVEEE